MTPALDSVWLCWSSIFSQEYFSALTGKPHYICHVKKMKECELHVYFLNNLSCPHLCNLLFFLDYGNESRFPAIIFSEQCFIKNHIGRLCIRGFHLSLRYNLGVNLCVEQEHDFPQPFSTTMSKSLKT